MGREFTDYLHIRSISLWITVAVAFSCPFVLGRKRVIISFLEQFSDAFAVQNLTLIEYQGPDHTDAKSMSQTRTFHDMMLGVTLTPTS